MSDVSATNLHGNQPVTTTDDTQSTQSTQQLQQTQAPTAPQVDQTAQVIAAVLTGGLSALLGSIFGAKPQTQLQQPPPPTTSNQQQAATGYAVPAPQVDPDWAVMSNLSHRLDAELAKGGKADPSMVASLQKQIAEVEARHQAGATPSHPAGMSVDYGSATPPPRTGASTTTDSTTTNSPTGDSVDQTKTETTSSGEPLEDARDHIEAGKENIENQIDDLSSKIDVEVAKGDKASQQVIDQYKRKIEKLSNTETSLNQLSNQIEQMIQNIANMQHETAMNAIRHIQ